MRPDAAPAPHKFTLDEARRIWASGVFADYPDMELIDGDLVEMPSDGPRTIDWNEQINRWLVKALPDHLKVVPDKTLDLMEHSAPQPDFYIHDYASAAGVTGQNVLLVIEVSDSTLDYDRGVKAALYAKGGVREYWIADCEGRQLLVHRLREDGAYGAPVVVAFDETAKAALIPLSLRLADLNLPA